MTTETKKLPKEIWVKRNKLNLVTLAIPGEGKPLLIFPGLTRITDEEHIKFIHTPKANHGWLALLETGAHELVSGKTESKKTSTTVFTAMSVKDSIKLIKETYSIPALEQLMNDETHKKSRKTVITAIEDQIIEMRTPDKKDGGE